MAFIDIWPMKTDVIFLLHLTQIYKYTAQKKSPVIHRTLYKIILYTVAVHFKSII